jgi:hypothetical protein
MVALRAESFLGIASTAEWISKHAGSITGAGHSFPGGNGRNGGNAGRANSGNAWVATYDSVATAYAGGAHKTPSLPAGTSELFSFLDATVTHITFNLKPDGAIDIRRGTTSGTLLATSAAGVIVAGSFSYVEFKALVANSGGIAECLVNGVSVVSFSGDTQNAGTAASTQAKFWHPATGSDWTDLYYGDTGAYYGDGRVELRSPSAAGNSTVLTRGGADSGANWSQVDEGVPNDDTDYVTSGTPGDKDTYAHQDLVSIGGVVKVVQIVGRMRKDDAGARSVVMVARLSATEVDGPAQTLNTSYATFADPRTTKPGGGAWTISDVNSAEFGVKINA